jgi:hypothetical protein
MTDDDILGTHLKEIKARGKTKSIDGLVMRMRTEQSFRRVLESLGITYIQKRRYHLYCIKRKQRLFLILSFKRMRLNLLSF